MKNILCGLTLALSFVYGVLPATALSPLHSASSATSLAMTQASAITPSASACQSPYDAFYSGEPGVYAFWGLCETGTNPAISDYVGTYNFAGGSSAGTLTGGIAGPVPDAETAIQASSANAYVQNQPIPVNSNSGLMAIWINADATGSQVTALALNAVGGNSGVSMGTYSQSGSLCFFGNWTNSSGSTANTNQCGFTPNAWHRVVLGWGNGFMGLSVDGTLRTVSSYSGSLDSQGFYYKLFPGSANTGKQMTLAKAVVANQGWSNAQVAQDYNPQITLSAPTQMVFGTQPPSAAAGTALSPAVTVLLADANGRIVKTSSSTVTLSLANAGNAALGGTLTASAINGQATFANLTVSSIGTGYQLIANSSGLPLTVSNTFSITPGTTTTAPVASASCPSAFDTFFASEPGVVASWPLCETGTNPAIHDYAGKFSYPASAITGGTLTGGLGGPLTDGESGIQATTALTGVLGQGIAVYTNSGTIATWINSDANYLPVSAISLNSIGGRSYIDVGVFSSGNSICYYGIFSNSGGNNSQVTLCGYTPNTWHRVALSWGNGFMGLAVDGYVRTVSQYHGSLDNTLFSYKLFAGCCDTGKQMTLAKAVVATQGWNGQQVAADYAPPVTVSTPTGPPSQPTAPVSSTIPHLVFSSQPGTALAAGTFNPSVAVTVDNADGSTATSVTSPISLSLINAAGASLNGTLTQYANNGQATFPDLSVATPGSNYQLVAQSPGLDPAISTAFTINPYPNGSTLIVPPANQCNSPYDIFYKSEPGVYSFWPMCEQGNPPKIYDYIGQWNFTGGWGPGTQIGGMPGPVPDGETAIKAPNGNAYLEQQDIPMNTNAGTIATWVNADGTAYTETALWFGAIFLQSQVSINTYQVGSQMCFNGTWVNSAGQSFVAGYCGYVPDTWHRVAFVWQAGSLALSVDGSVVATGTYTGALDDTIFYYRLFPDCCSNGKQMTLAKALISNQAWSAAQLAADYQPTLIAPPTGGVYITNTQLGTIHRDVMGIADANQNISDAAHVSALNTGLAAGGVTAVKFAGGSYGISADGQDWQDGSVSCTGTAGVTVPAKNIGTADNVYNYTTRVAQPLGLHLGYVVNYGSNPPYCTAGGDPIANGANLVNFVNNQMHFGYKYFEIGNEQFSRNSAIDLHPNPWTSASYLANEPAFYNSMKAQDPTILVGVPVAGAGVYYQQAQWDLPLMASAKYDAVVLHTYPIQDPVSDGTTLYQDRVSSPTNIHGPLLTLQTELLNAGRDPGAIWITEWSEAVSGTQWSKESLGAVMPLFAMTELAEYMQAGVQYATWWAQGEAGVCSTVNYDYTDEAAYAYWECGSTAFTYTGPIANVGEVNVGFKSGDLMPAARAFQVLAQSGFVVEGEHMLQTQTDQVNSPWLEGYAGTHNGSYAVILINRDRDAAHTVPVQLAGKGSGGSVSQWSYGRAQYDPAYFGNWSVPPVQTNLGAWNGTFPATLQPWSINVFVFNP